jgi:hypothetical protein
MTDQALKEYILLLAMAGKISSHTAAILLEDHEPTIKLRERPKLLILIEEEQADRVLEFNLHASDLSFSIENIVEESHSRFRDDPMSLLVVGIDISIEHRHWISKRYSVEQVGEWIVYIVKNAIPYDPSWQHVMQSVGGGMHIVGSLREKNLGHSHFSD